MSDTSHTHDLGQDQPVRRGPLGLLVALFLGLADSLHRNILLALLVLASSGAAFQLSIFETSLIGLLIYITLVALASMSGR